MSKNTFKSKVHHLFHGHETVRDNKRFPVFEAHKAYTREGWLNHLRSEYDWGRPLDGTVNMEMFKTYINETLLYVHKTSIIPRITVCITNFLRYDMLVKSLTALLNSGVPLNVILWVNESGSMTDKHKNTVLDVLKEFKGHDVIYSAKNMGTGYPRYMMLNKARYEYDTEYIMTMDDDILHSSPDTIVLGATVLDQKEYSDYGAMGIWCEPQYNIVRVNGSSLTITRAVEGFHEVDCLGAANMTIRRSVLEKCNCDPQYIIGLVDWDFSMSMRKEGFKLGLVCDNRYKPNNDVSENNKMYTDGRWDGDTISNSKSVFKRKWGITIK